MHEDLKILCYGDELRIILPINETTIERAIAIIKERGLTKLSIVRNTSQAPAYSLKFLNDFTEAAKITSLELYAYFYDFDSIYRFENLESLDCFIFNDETLDLSRFQKLKELNTFSLEPFMDLNNSTIEELCVFGEFGSTVLNTKLDPKKLSQLHRLKCLRLLHKVKDFSFEEVGVLDNLEKIVIKQCNIKNLNGIEKCTQVKDITLWYCSSLNDISAIKKLPNLLSLDIGPCPRLKNIDDIVNIESLRALCLHGCKNVDIEIIRTLKALRFLYLENCNPIPSIKFINDLEKMVGMTLLCTKIVDGDLTPAMRLKNTNIMVMRHYNIDEDKLPSVRRTRQTEILRKKEQKKVTKCQTSRIEHQP